MSDQNYDANDMQHLENLDAVRKRVGMYLGSSDSRAKNHTVFEIFDNSVDEAIAGYCTDITVTLHQDGSVEVEDNGRGVPTDIHKKTGLPAVIAVFTLLHFGGKFGGGTYKSAGGLHGVGASVVNAVSSRLDFTVKRDGQVIAGSFQRGKPGKFSGEGSDAKFTPHPPQTLTTVRKMKKGEQTGTNVRYWHDKTIFLPESKIEAGAIRQRLRQTAFLIPGLTLTLNDHLTHPDNPKTETFKYDGGIVDMVDVTSHDTKICDTIHIQGSGTFKETVPMLNKDGEMVSTEMERTVDVDVALRWGNGYDTHVNTFVNVVATPNGGTHLKGFERALVQTLRKAYDGTRLLKANDDPPILEDFEEGLTAVVSIGVPEPQFVGQTKEELGTAGVTKVVQTVVAEGLSAWVNGKKKTQVRTVLEKVANASKVRVAHRTQKDAARRKTALEGASMPAKLVDCRAIGVEGSEIFVVEGDSALGSARQGRNSEYQALLPIRGKILNVQKASLKQMLDNTECASIIQVLGAGSGKTFDLEQMRYDRLVMMSVPADETVLLYDAEGRLGLWEIGPFVDGCVSGELEYGAFSTVALNEGDRCGVVAPLKGVVRHRYRGIMRRLGLEYGRSVRVTGNHSVFTWEDGKVCLRESSELGVGDVVVAPQRLPEPVNLVAEVTVEGDVVVRVDEIFCGNVGKDVGGEIMERKIVGGADGVPDYMFNVSAPNRAAFLQGLANVFRRDDGGNFGEENGGEEQVGEEKVTQSGMTVVVRTEQKKVANEVAYLLTSIGAVPNIIVGETGEYEVSTHNISSVSAPFLGEETHSGVVNISDTLFGLPIVSVEDETVDEDVYDLSVADMESFVTGFGGGVMAHNTDADSDGLHILTLICAFAVKQFRPLVEAGRLFSAMPPLFKVETTGRNKEKFYVHSNKELDVLLARLKKERKQVKYPIQRYKGLGEMDAEELWETTMDPATRTIKRITMSDAEAAEEMLELLMGSDVPNRRQYLIDNSENVEDLDI